MNDPTPRLAPDPALPARDAHLDPDWVAARLTALTGRTVRPLQLVRCKYRIGESLRVVHRLTVDGELATVTGRTFVGGASVTAAHRSPAAVHDAQHDTVWWWFPDDRRLRGVEDVVHPSAYLAESLGLHHWAATQVAEYAPERSLTVRAADVHDRAIAYVKLYAPGTVDLDAFAARYERGARTFAGDRAVSVPRVLARSGDLLAITAMPGVAWTALGPTERERGLALLGQAIARFHTTPGDGIAAPFGRLTVRRVVHSAELVAQARPDVAPALAEIARRLADGPPPDDTAPVLLHGDCHPKNSLFDGDRLALIDLDQAGIGSPACDVASFLARLQHGTVLGETTPEEADVQAAAFLTGYAAVRPLPGAAGLRWHLAAALVAERAMRAVNRVNSHALDRLPELVELAAAVARPARPASATPPATRAGGPE